jgi:hypothetical protein
MRHVVAKKRKNLSFFTAKDVVIFEKVTTLRAKGYKVKAGSKGEEIVASPDGSLCLWKDRQRIKRLSRSARGCPNGNGKKLVPPGISNAPKASRLKKIKVQGWLHEVRAEPLKEALWQFREMTALLGSHGGLEAMKEVDAEIGIRIHTLTGGAEETLQWQRKVRKKSSPSKVHAEMREDRPILHRE